MISNVASIIPVAILRVFFEISFRRFDWCRIFQRAADELQFDSVRTAELGGRTAKAVLSVTRTPTQGNEPQDSLGEIEAHCPACDSGIPSVPG